jgi:ATP adenylyltransferase
MNNNTECHFCNISEDRIIADGATCVVIRDLYPVTPLHTLIITKRHVGDYFDLNELERLEIHQHLEEQKKRIEQQDETITGFNIGINCGEDAGQTIMHCHVHLIPRCTGDTDNPRGGVRGVIPDKQSY